MPRKAASTPKPKPQATFEEVYVGTEDDRLEFLLAVLGVPTQPQPETPNQDQPTAA